jgi:hypothetical protein
MTGKTMRWAVAAAVLAGVLAGGLTGDPAGNLFGGQSAWAQGNAPSPLSKVNRALPGLRTGVLTTAKGGTVRIDSFQYQLAPGALIEDTRGNPVPLQEYVWDGVEIPAQYWLGHEAKDKQIIQMILTFAE